jgi:hypothetical protein
MSGRPEINGMKSCVHGCYYDVCKKNPCKGMYQAWLLDNIKDKDFENWKARNQGRADGVDAMIYLLERFKKRGHEAEMKDDISTLIARVKCL